MRHPRSISHFVVIALASAACEVAVEQSDGNVDSRVTASGKRAALSGNGLVARLGAVREVAWSMGSHNPLLFAAIGYHESGLAQCWSEADWTCQGPFSEDCGGPVVAGAWDGPCSARQGGLGMFQLDSGSYDDTLAAHGAGVLSVAGNISAGASFIVYKVRICPNTPNFNSDGEVLSWLDRAVPGSSEYEAFFTAMAWCYNGCAPSYTSCSHDTVRVSYRNAAENLRATMGDAFWFGAAAPAEPPPPTTTPPPAEPPPVEQPPPATDACGGLSYQGSCEAGVVRWCENGALREHDCTSDGRGCAWQDNSVGYNCVGGCGQLDYAGACLGQELRWCEGGAVRTHDCAGACGWQNDAVGNNCL